MPHPFPDHHPFRAGDLEFGDAAPVVMTEKDAVKCKRFAQAHHWVFPVSASLDPAFGRWLLEKLGGSQNCLKSWFVRSARGPLVHRREAAELICKADRLGFPVKDGIPVMLEEDARKLPPEEEAA